MTASVAADDRLKGCLQERDLERRSSFDKETKDNKDLERVRASTGRYRLAFAPATLTGSVDKNSWDPLLARAPSIFVSLVRGPHLNLISSHLNLSLNLNLTQLSLTFIPQSPSSHNHQHRHHQQWPPAVSSTPKGQSSKKMTRRKSPTSAPLSPSESALNSKKTHMRIPTNKPLSPSLEMSSSSFSASPPP